MNTPSNPSYSVQIADACSSPCLAPCAEGVILIYSVPEWESQLRVMGLEYDKVRKRLENAWHEQAWRGHTNDSHRHDHKSTEFGWSVMTGGSTKQRVAQVCTCGLADLAACDSDVLSDVRRLPERHFSSVRGNRTRGCHSTRHTFRPSCALHGNTCERNTRARVLRCSPRCQCSIGWRAPGSRR